MDYNNHYVEIQKLVTSVILRSPNSTFTKKQVLKGVRSRIRKEKITILKGVKDEDIIAVIDETIVKMSASGSFRYISSKRHYKLCLSFPAHTCHKE